MAIYYLDSSAVVKYYVLEPGSTWMRGLIDAADADGQPLHSFFLADITIAEVAAAFAILHRTHRIHRSAWENSFSRFMEEADTRYDIAPSEEANFVKAAHLTRRYALKAYDAVQLAMATHQQAELEQIELALTLITGDLSLLAAAQAEGLTTDNPFNHVLPQDTPQP